MENIPILEFGGKTMEFEEITFDITPFLNYSYKCICGDNHIVKNVKDGLIRQLSQNRIVLRNNNCKTVSCFQFKNDTLKPLYAAELK